MDICLRILAMALLVVPTQKIVRVIISGLLGHGYNFTEFGLSNIMVIILSIASIFLSLFLFHITKPFFNKGLK